MAKLFETYSINPKYTKPFRVKFCIYLAGAFEGFGDISYYTIIINDNQEEKELSFDFIVSLTQYAVFDK